ncbi:MAG: cytochrome oxidase small assembly protein [Rhodocyclaceae bacterium]|nr:cytochrome oxidase small assembly protein [Rhodocyclaceae bacterium]
MTTSPAPNRRANIRTALILAGIAMAFFAAMILNHLP